MTKEDLTVKRGQGIEPGIFNRGNFTQFQTWLGETKSVEGCPTDCKYCFFQLDGQTPIKPKINISPEKTLDLISKTYTYHSEMPLHFGSQTDAFSTKKNINFYTELLLRYGESNYNNPLIFVTKEEIPDDFIKKVKQIKQKVVFFISYSGLSDSKIEPNVSTDSFKNSFFKLYEAKIPRVHYWRPFLPFNSSQEKIESVLEFVNKYATCSVVNGLRLNDGIRNNLIEFWPELSNKEYDFKKVGEFWPEGVRNFIPKYVSEKYPDYPLFMGNTPCSLAYALEVSDISGLYKGRMCLDSLCLDSQRSKCNNAYKKPSLTEVLLATNKMEIKDEDVSLEEDKILIKGNVETGKRIYLKTILKFPVLTENTLYDGGYNWANVVEENQVTEVPWRDNWTNRTF